MGCSSSKQTVADDSAMLRKARGPRGSMIAVGYKVQQTAPAKEAGGEAARVIATAPADPLPVPAAGCSLRYATLSQRGYYPDAPNKANQDAVLVQERLGGSAGTHLWGVFDGHGEFGAECAQFVQQQLPGLLAGHPALATAPEDALHAALVGANAALHASPIDDSLSGTTACCALLVGDILYVANVGDSRAVIAERPDPDAEAGASTPSPRSSAGTSTSASGSAAAAGSGSDGGGGGASPLQRLEPRDLSLDQTPFRADECLRVLQAGARVMTLDQLEGLKDPGLPCWTSEADCDGDPPRLWHPAGMFPGTAFTRSLGDSAAEGIGVIADPEVSATRLDRRAAFCVVATDGVWEFISSRAAVDLVAQHSSPADAAKALVAQAYKLWLQRETRTDDISAVVLFFDWTSGSAEVAGAASASAPASARQQPEQQQADAPQLQRAPSSSRRPDTPSLGLSGLSVAA